MLHVHHHDANLSEIPLVGDTAILKETFSGTYMHMEKLKMNKRVSFFTCVSGACTNFTFLNI